MALFSVTYSERAVQNILALDASVAKRIRAAIDTKLSADPELFGKPLQHSLRGLWSLRVGEWRVLFGLSDKVVIVYAIQHRKKGYASLS